MHLPDGRWLGIAHKVKRYRFGAIYTHHLLVLEETAREGDYHEDGQKAEHTAGGGLRTSWVSPAFR